MEPGNALPAVSDNKATGHENAAYKKGNLPACWAHFRGRLLHSR
jgi:hypothetical protein